MPSITGVTDDDGTIQVAHYRYADGSKVVMDGTAKAASVPVGVPCVRLFVDGSATVYMRADGQPAVAEAAATVPLPAGTVDLIAVQGGISLIGASGTVYVMPFVAV